jgi:hypothetical protein
MPDISPASAQCAPDHGAAVTNLELRVKTQEKKPLILGKLEKMAGPRSYNLRTIHRADLFFGKTFD